MGKTKRLLMSVICLISLSLGMVYSEVPVYATEVGSSEDITNPSGEGNTEEGGETTDPSGTENGDTTESGDGDESGSGSDTEQGGEDNNEPAATFTVESEDYTLTYEVDADNAKVVALTKCEVKNPDDLEGNKLSISIASRVQNEGNEYFVGKIKENAFKNCKIKRYRIPSDIHEVDMRAFDSEDIVVFDAIKYTENYETKKIVISNFDSEAIKYILFCGDGTTNDTTEEDMKAILSVDAESELPDNVVKVDNSSVGVLALKKEEGQVKEDAFLSTATVSMVDYVTGEDVNGQTKWDDVGGENSTEKQKPESYKMDSSRFDTSGKSKEQYGFTFTAANYLPYSAKVNLVNAVTVVTVNGFDWKLELSETSNDQDGTVTRTAAIISCVPSGNAEVTSCDIPDVFTVDGQAYSVTDIAEGAFWALDKVNTYVVPAGIKKIQDKAFYDRDKAENRVILLRMTATSLDKLPDISGSYQKDDNKNNRFAMIFAPALKNSYNELRNKYGNLVGWSEEFLQVAVSDVLTEKLMYGGKKTMDADVYYDPASGKNTMTYVNTTITDETKYKDFLTNAELATTVAWEVGKDQYVFNYPDGKQTFTYTISAQGYIGITKSQEFDPQSMSGYTYELKNGTLSVTGYKGKETELKIPASEADAYRAYNVTAIGSQAFRDNDNYRKLTIPKTVVSVEQDAFRNVNYMEIVVEAGNPNYIAIDNFLYSADKTTLIAAPSAHGEVRLPEGTVKLGNYAFAGCSRVQSVIIPSTVTMIGTTNDGAYTFSQMRNLETIRFSNYNPATLTIMGNHMLEGSSLRDVYYPEGTTAAYTAALQAAGIYLNDNVKVYEWKPTYNTIVTMDGTEVKHVNPADSTKTYTWTSSNTDVVIVEADGAQGKLTAVGNGEAVITATAADGTSYKWTVNVTLSETVYKTAFPYASVTLGKKDGKKADQVTVNTISVPRGTQLKSATVKNKKIATVKLSKDKKGVVITSAKKTGKTTVTVTDVNGKTATLNVTVKKAPTKKNFKLAKSSVTLKKKQTYQIALKKSVACQKVTYTLSKAAKKIVSVNKTGLVTAKKKGTAKITVKSYNGKTATLTVKVK
ncbi:MAG: leucine-rich repeat protein [Lachnospiraceae bacterium]|nr:leucine-rich repeat protein [Lachnospiraceae bacterium]MDE6625795.1 leucine-rich repeat protein [Lachnospiraceae bacterium]